MTPDSPTPETALRQQHAAALDPTFLSRLTAAADGTLTELTPAELCFEQFLREISPARLSPALTAAVQEITRHAPFSLDEKIVLFPKSNPASRKEKARPIWSAAAAVALIGAASALLFPTAKPQQNFPASPAIASTTPPRAAPNIVPASVDRGVSEVQDQGFVWKDNQQAHSVLRVIYKDKITLKDTLGRTFEVEQPSVKYLLVPAKTD